MSIALLLLLRRPVVGHPLRIWLLAGLLPVLVSVTVALHGQEVSARVLEGLNGAPEERVISWYDPQRGQSNATVSLSVLDAACVVHAAPQGGHYRLTSSTLYVPPGLQLVGNWPTQEQVRALMISGQLQCRRLGDAPTAEAGE